MKSITLKAIGCLFAFINADRKPGARSQVVSYFLLVVVTSVLAWILVGGPQFDPSIPLIYAGDGLLHSWWIKRLLDNPWYFYSEACGYPFGSDFLDFPNSDAGSFVAQQLLARLFGSYAYGLNAYYLLGFPLASVSSYYVLLKLLKFRPLAFAGALIYAFLPFHFLRIVHLFYTWYFTLPLFVAYAIHVYYAGRGWWRPRSKWTLLGHGVVLLVASCFGVYYAFFGVIVIASAGFAGALRRRSWIPVGMAVAVGSVIAVGVLANITPNIIYHVQYGENKEMAQRTPRESEVYGLKITQLLLPRPSHRVSQIAGIYQQYLTNFDNSNDNGAFSLGLIGSLGFLVMLGYFASPSLRALPPRFHILAFVTLMLTLAATIGGFSSLFALFISPLIRAWGRAAFFIGFTSIAAAMLACEALLVRLKVASPAAIASIALALVVFALWDQTVPPDISFGTARIVRFQSDENFVRQIERTVSPGSAIFQLPYALFPEGAPVNQMSVYDPLVGYLHSRTLKWSYGGTRGRPGDLFYRSLSQKPLAVQLKIARRLGFTGIYVDRQGYADHGVTLEAELSHNLGKPAIVSQDSNLVFYKLPRDPADPPVSVQGSADQIIRRIGLVDGPDHTR